MWIEDDDAHAVGGFAGIAAKVAREAGGDLAHSYSPSIANAEVAAAMWRLSSWGDDRRGGFPPADSAPTPL